MTQNVQAPLSNDEIAKEMKEKQIIDTKITAALEDMHHALENHVHAQMFYHAKSLECWHQIWDKLHASSPNEHDEDDIEENGEVEEYDEETQKELDKLKKEQDEEEKKKKILRKVMGLNKSASKDNVSTTNNANTVNELKTVLKKKSSNLVKKPSSTSSPRRYHAE